MMNLIKIDGQGKRYLSQIDEFKNGLPFGIVNKVLTDVGGTYCAINCDSNYIVVVPFKDLANSIELDTNNKYEVFKVFGGTSKLKFKEYINSKNVKKIAVTYDSLPKLISWLEDYNEDLKEYKLLIDEYHLILEDMDFRDTAIIGMLDTVKEFKHYTFLSATPVNTDFEIDFFKDLPHYELEWGDIIKIKPTRVKTTKVYEAVCKLINIFNSKDGLITDDITGKLAKVEELHIFMNSVEGISTILHSLEVSEDDVKIVCADTIRNGMVLGKYKVSSITEENCKINFYTKKGFQGCNVFTNNGLIVVVSDAKKDNMLIDIETSLTQIQGRLRFNDIYQNIFRHKIWHIYSTLKTSLTDDEFKELMDRKESERDVLYNDLISKSPDVRKIFLERLNVKADLLTIVNGEIYINNYKKQLFIYKHNLKKMYSDGYSVRLAYDKSGRFERSNQNYINSDEVTLSKITKVSFEDIYKKYLEGNDEDRFDIEYPKFREYKEYLTIENMASLKWNEDKIDKRVQDLKLIDKIFKNDIIGTKVDGFLQTSFIVDKLKSKFSEYNIDIKPKASLIEDINWLEVRKTTKRLEVKGHSTKQLVNGYEIKLKNIWNYLEYKK